MHDLDVLVIGAGPSGCVSAAILHKSGLQVEVVEREQFPRFVIGESLLPRCMEALDEAGFLEVLKEKGFQQKFGAKFVRGEQICDFNFADQYTEGFNWTWQVPRADFDMTLAEELQKRGVPIQFRVSVVDIEFASDHQITTVRSSEGKVTRIRSRFIIDSSGYGRVIPKLLHLDEPSDLPPRQTYFAHMTDTNRDRDSEPNRITILSVKPGMWAWMIPFSTGSTSVGFVGGSDHFQEFQGDNAAILRDLIKSDAYSEQRFADQDFIFEPKKLEGWSVTTHKFYGEGFVLTGNVTEFLDPMFSSGVTLAVVSGAKAANIVVRKLAGEPYDWETEYMIPTRAGVDVFRTFVKAWYDGTLPSIFFANALDHHFKKQICSVLAGYVWDESNPFVTKRERALKSLAEYLRLQAPPSPSFTGDQAGLRG